MCLLAEKFKRYNSTTLNIKYCFCFRYKLERGSLSAFKREASNIIERDLPLILHRDNIIKVFTDKVSHTSFAN